MKAAMFALKSFVTKLTGKHTKIIVDNSTTVFVINNMGTNNHNELLHNLAVEIWEFCLSHKKKRLHTYLGQRILLLIENQDIFIGKVSG